MLLVGFTRKTSQGCVVCTCMVSIYASHACIWSDMQDFGLMLFSASGPSVTCLTVVGILTPFCFEGCT